uniref:Uncharacterized protein n=1 Tax=Noctiluca scintillans TaxID=2966 RepID=A0A7S1EYF8_NOCSC|mmetsp:Transcript_18452/g.49504  ORF Transcript_18452/g.49504 Transcript_18452/m.49504 type:complete len:154 (+) Transcript_18452:55-516(+)
MVLLQRFAHLRRAIRPHRSIATTAVRAHQRLDTLLVQPSERAENAEMGAMTKMSLAGSPLFLTDLNAPFYWGEIQFVLSGPINGLFERLFETEAGPQFLNAVALCTLLRMALYYGFLQPSYLWHFQERYGQTWTVGHHLYGSTLPNPLKKGSK